MFYFLIHLPLIHGLAVVVCYARYGAVHWMFESPDPGTLSLLATAGVGFSLGRSISSGHVVVSLYPAMRWFAALKQRRQDAGSGISEAMTGIAGNGRMKEAPERDAAVGYSFKYKGGCQ
jgi:hypothetical protein